MDLDAINRMSYDICVMASPAVSHRLTPSFQSLAGRQSHLPDAFLSLRRVGADNLAIVT